MAGKNGHASRSERGRLPEGRSVADRIGGARRTRARPRSAMPGRGETVKLSSFGSFVVRDKGAARRPQSEDRHRGADRAAPGDGLQAIERAQGAHQRRGRRRRTTSDPRPSGAHSWTRAPTLSAPSARSPTTSTCRSTCCASGKRASAQIRPLKRGGGRRYYRPDDVDLLKGIRQLLYGEGYTIKGVQRILKEEGIRFVQSVGRGEQSVERPSRRRQRRTRPHRPRRPPRSRPR